MAFDPGLLERIHDILAEVSGVTGKPMFGGYGVFRNARMFAGIFRTALMAKLGTGAAEAMLEPYTAWFDPMGKGKSMTGWITVESAGIETDQQLRSWLDRALAAMVGIKTTPRKRKTRTKPSIKR